ncbi:MAG: ABC transporter permease [Devosia sp.]|nr:ABC transporter permease [Devosia sp.]
MIARPDLPGIRWGLVAGGGVGLLLAVLALTSLVWVPFPLAGPPLTPLAEPGGLHLLGTDQAGRDVVSLLMTAALSSLAVAGFGTLIALLVGVPAGALMAARFGAGPSPGRVSGLLLAPALIVAMLLTALGSAGPGTAILSVALPGAVAAGLAARAPVAMLLRRDYVAAARIAGLNALSAMQRHVLPALLPVVAALGLELFAVAILVEASLGFLGLAAGMSGTGLGVMLRDTQGFMQIRPLLAIAPGVTIVSLILALQLVARGLRRGIDGTA